MLFVLEEWHKMTEQTPIYTQYREGNQDNPYVYKNENLIIDKNAKAFLTEFPERLYGVEVQSITADITFYETQESSVRENEFRVDYESKTKSVTFHQSQIGKQLNFVYKGTGMSYLSPSQIYTELNDEGVMETLDVYIKNMSKLKNQIENLLEKGSVATVAGKSGIVTNGDIHLIDTVLDGNAGNSATFLPLGVTLYPVKSKNINYPAEKGFVVTYKHSNIQTVQFFYPTEKEATHFRSWMSNTWSDWKTLTTATQVNQKIEQSALRTNTPQTLVGRAIKDVKGLNLSVDLGGLSGSKRLVRDGYKLEFTATKDSMIERISFPVNGRGSVKLILSEKKTPEPKEGEASLPIITEVDTRELYLQPVDVSHLILFPLKKGKTYQLSLADMSVDVLFETDFNAKDIAVNEYIKNTQLTLNASIINGYAYFYDMQFSYNIAYQEVVDARIDYWGNEHNSLKESMDANVKPFDEIENGFDLQTMEPMFVGNLATLRNAVLQAFNIDVVTNQYYAGQSDSLVPEGFVITQISPNGSIILSSMAFPNAGHGTTFGLENRDGRVFIWTIANTEKNEQKLVCVPYTPNSTFTLDDNIKDYTPKSLSGIYFTPVIDMINGNILIRRGDGLCELRSLIDVKNGVDKILHSVQVPKTENGDDRPMQGAVTNGTTLYWYSGWSTNAVKVLKYDMTTKKLLDTREVNLPNETGGAFTDSYREPEGLAYYVNPYTEKESLLMGITSGGGNKRYHMVYAFHQRGAQEHFDSLRAIAAQNYAITRGDGRAHSVPDGLTKLSDLRRAGEYYMTAAIVDTLTDLPSPQFKGAGLYVKNTAGEQHYNLRQILTRSSYSRKNMTVERSLDYDGKFGSWTVHETSSEKYEYVDADLYKNKLSNITLSGEYYMTIPQTEKFSDHPEKGVAGWWLRVSSGDSASSFRQELLRNSNNYIQTYQRIVDGSGVAGEWFKVLDIGKKSYANISVTGGAKTDAFTVTNSGDQLIIRGNVDAPLEEGVYATLPVGYRPSRYWETMVGVSGTTGMRKIIVRNDGTIHFSGIIANNPSSITGTSLYMIVPVN